MSVNSVQRKVVISGLGIASPIGANLSEASRLIQSDGHGIRRWSPWEAVDGLRTRLAAAVTDIELRGWPRKKSRSMGRVARLAAWASERAIEDAQLDRSLMTSERLGLAYGSTHGSSAEMERFAYALSDGPSLLGIGPNEFLRFMSHTCAMNLASLFEIRGRVLTTCSACVSGSQAIGFGYEAIRSGTQDVMLCGGADELHFMNTGMFDILQLTSVGYNAHPNLSPRPFDRDRDGLVVGEGAGTLVLEEQRHAEARGAAWHAEVVGFGTSCDVSNLTSPARSGMERAMRDALDDAALEPSDIDYINAHATGTAMGDIAESHATWAVFGDEVPTSSTKGFTGHTLGACGPIEAALCIAMIRDEFLAPNRNLSHPDPECAPLRYVRERTPAMVNYAMCNNFAFGGINTSLILKRPDRPREDPAGSAPTSPAKEHPST